ncbi:hypothetical protein OE88DRAFT_1650458 [Heliocybe sulcata]|uniref:Uncharacterized protein n=1 Tax=Heliocybe sulcata TaxID=5364 RepID=A0A5C3NKD8_9AGAM|nr:hypothetical protein OE88DRAFT_1650458 [Heliocybe sulcata]
MARLSVTKVSVVSQVCISSPLTHLVIDERPYDPRPYDSRYARDFDDRRGGRGGHRDEYRGGRGGGYDRDYREDYDRGYRDYDRRYDDRRGGGGGYEDRRYEDRRYEDRRY